MAVIIDGDAATIGKIFFRDDAGRGMVTSFSALALDDGTSRPPRYRAAVGSIAQTVLGDIFDCRGHHVGNCTAHAALEDCGSSLQGLMATNN